MTLSNLQTSNVQTLNIETLNIETSNIQPRPTWAQVIKIGALTGIGLTFAYVLFFAFYAIVRSSLTLITSLDSSTGFIMPLLANAMAIFVAALASATLFSFVSALFGVVTALLVKGLDMLLNPKASVQRATLIGLGASMTVVILIGAVFQLLLGRSLNSLGQETYLFWFGLPSILQIGAGVVGGWYLHQSYRRAPTKPNHTKHNEVHHVEPRAYSGTS